jgi:hypothetical protein
MHEQVPALLINRRGSNLPEKTELSYVPGNVCC